MTEGGAQCPVCASPDTTYWFSKRGHAVRRCDGCDVAFHPATPSTRDLEELYSASYFHGGGFEAYADYLGDERVHRRQARYYLDRVAALGIAPGRLLDVGCAAGFFLDEARHDGWRTIGCEISDFAAQHATHALGLDVARVSFLDADFEPGTFDMVTMFSVIAHLPQPVDVAAKVYELLRPGGYLVIEASNRRSLAARALGTRWHLFSPPSVLFFHTRRSLERLFPSGRWEPVNWRPSIKWISVEHAVSRLEHRARSPLLRRTLALFGRSPLAQMDLPYMLGDLVLAVYRKR